MAHAIAEIGGRDAMAYIDETPWHKLGRNILALMRATVAAGRIDLALDEAQMRYQVASVPLYLADGTPVADHRASVRLAADGTVAAQFGVVGKGHTHVQNERAVDILRPLVETFGYVPAAAGALGQGERCWMLLRAADATISPVPGDSVNGYALLHWGHTGDLAISLLGTTVRVVCQNTLSMATNGRTSWLTIRHTSSADARVDQAAKLVEQLGQRMALTGDTFASLARRNMTADQVRAFVDGVIPAVDAAGKTSARLQARRDSIVQLVTSGRGADMANSLVPDASLWGVVNAVSEYFDHVRPAEATNDSGRLRAAESAIFGGNADAKAFALSAARQLLGAAA